MGNIINLLIKQFLARDVMYTSRAYATTSVSVSLSVTEVHCGRSACREEGRGHLALCYPLLGPLVSISLWPFWYRFVAVLFCGRFGCTPNFLPSNYARFHYWPSHDTDPNHLTDTQVPAAKGGANVIWLLQQAN